VPGRGLIARPVTIEDGVGIGARAIILKGRTIGAGSVIGTGAIVTKESLRNNSLMRARVLDGSDSSARHETRLVGG